MRDQIISKAIKLGADVAGIARSKELVSSPSYQKYELNPYYDHDGKKVFRPDVDTSILVFGLSHPKSMRELDWWDSEPGGTPGNRILIQIQNEMRKWVKEELGLEAESIRYKLNFGGVFLKDAAVLGGVGIIGKNNLLITPDHGPQIRLRGLLLLEEIEASPPLDFSPCDECNAPCLQSCPQDAFRSGEYEMEYCWDQMKIDEDRAKPNKDDPKTILTRYCRVCELTCVIGK